MHQSSEFRVFLKNSSMCKVPSAPNSHHPPPGLGKTKTTSGFSLIAPLYLALTQNQNKCFSIMCLCFSSHIYIYTVVDVYCLFLKQKWPILRTTKFCRDSCRLLAGCCFVLFWEFLASLLSGNVFFWSFVLPQLSDSLYISWL